MEGTYKNTADIQISIITIVFSPALTSAPNSWSYLALNLRSLPGSKFEVLTWLWIWGPWGRSSSHCPVGSECPILFGFLLCVKFSRTFSSSHQLCLYFLCHNPTKWYFIHLLYMFNFNFLPIDGYLVQIATSPSPSFLSSFLKFKSWTPLPPPWCTYKLSSCSCGFSALSCFINLYKYVPVYVGYM